MVTENSVTAEELASVFASRIEQMAARRLFVGEDGDRIHFWLETDSISPEEESAFYGVIASLYDDYPNAYIRLHIINPRTFPDANYRFSGVAVTIGRL